MESTFNHNIKVDLNKNTNKQEISIEINNLPVNFVFDMAAIKRQIAKLQGKENITTLSQNELDFEIVNGVEYLEDDFIRITNSQIKINFNTHSNEKNKPINTGVLRPGHVDYVSMMKYPQDNLQDNLYLGEQLMSPVVFIGFLYRQILKKEYPNLKVYSHVKNFMDVKDISYYEIRKHIISHLNYQNLTKYNHIQLQMLSKKLYENLHSLIKKGLNYQSPFPTFNKKAGEKMVKKIKKLENDTVGGEIETIVINPPASLGDPLFHSTEALISQMIYSIPAIKGITFGNNYRFINKLGSQVKDEIIYIDQHKVTTIFNNNGGINGGITNGEDIVFTTTLKPISSIGQKQLTYSIKEKKVVEFELEKQNNVTIINRVIPIIDAMTYISIYDLKQKA